MTKVKSVCVFCGASARVDAVHREAARTMGRLLAANGLTLVFGGGAVGLMGLLADGALEAGGRVVGVIPQHLQDWEVGHAGLTELHVVDSMHSRKAKMFSLSDAFVVLPGGFGTLDEMFEILTWKQIHLHDRPLIVVDVNGYWQPLRALVAHMVANGFAHADNLSLLHFVDSVEEVLAAIGAEAPPHFPSSEQLL